MGLVLRPRQECYLFGQLLNPTLWPDGISEIWGRSLARCCGLTLFVIEFSPYILGRFVFISLIVLGATLTSRRTFAAAVVALIGFAIPFLVFTNLHIVHNYYQNANAIFLIAAVGLGIGRIFDSTMRTTAIVLLIILAAGELSFFYARFAPLLDSRLQSNRLLRIAQLARDITDKRATLIVIGDDWSSAVPYLSNRKSLALPAWTPKPLINPSSTIRNIS